MQLFIFCKKTYFLFNVFNTFSKLLSACIDRRNLTSVSNVCEAAPMSLSWEPNGLNELPFQGANHDTYSNPGTQVRSQEQGFGAVLQTELTRV